MNRSHENRSLRLERLESRSMLAGDAFEFAPNHQVSDVSRADLSGIDLSHTDHRSLDTRPAEHRHFHGQVHQRGEEHGLTDGVRTDGNSGRDEVSTARHEMGRRLHGEKRHADRMHREKQSRNEQDQAAPVQLSSSLIQPVLTQNPVPDIRSETPLSTDVGQPVESSVELTLSAPVRERALQSVARGVLVPSEVATGDVLSAASVKPDADRSADELPSETVIDASESVAAETDLAFDPNLSEIIQGEIFDGQSSEPQNVAEALDVAVENGVLDEEGFIEWSPLAKQIGSKEGARGTWGSEEETSLADWHLGDGSLSRLEKIAQDRVDSEVVDQTMREALDDEWFNPQSGMIALTQVRLPTLALQVSPMMVEWGLESAVALHRSVDSVSNVIAPALSGPALDAIMASLQHVASSDAQPVGQTSSFRLSAATYPTAVVVAATVAASSRRKQKRSESNLQFTPKT